MTKHNWQPRSFLILSGWLLLFWAGHGISHQFFAGAAPHFAGMASRLALEIPLVGLLVLLAFASTPGLPRLGLTSGVTILFWLGLMLWGHHLSHLPLEEAKQAVEDLQSSFGMRALAVALLLYALLLALPFVPAMELGLILMLCFGREIIPFVYLATVVGLAAAFAMGRVLPVERVQAALAGARRGKAATSDPPWQNLPPWAKAVSRYQLVALALLLNLPGNAALGGGGGIAMAWGAFSKISWPYFLLTVLLAVSPVPLALHFGLVSLEALLA